MEGILYLTDENNERRFVQIDLEKYGEELQDFLDGLVVDARRNDEKVPLEEVAADLIAAGKLEANWNEPEKA